MSHNETTDRHLKCYKFMIITVLIIAAVCSTSMFSCYANKNAQYEQVSKMLM